MPTDAPSSPFRRRARMAPFLAWIAAGLTVLVLAAFFYQASDFKALQADEEAVKKAPAARQVVASRSTLTGFDEHDQPYAIEAGNTVQDPERPNLLHLEKVTGHLLRSQAPRLDLSADKGIYDTKTKILELVGDVRLVSKDQFTARLEKATVIVKEKRLTASVPVVVTFANGSITAQGVEVSDDGNDIRFTGGVKSVFARQDAKEDIRQ